MPIPGITQQSNFDVWKIKNKLAQVVMEREDDKSLDGHVEMDDADLGSQRHDSKRGRGAPGKKPFLAAIKTTNDGKPVRIKLRRVKRFPQKDLRAFADKQLKITARAVTDDLGCFCGVAAAGRGNEPLVVSRLGHSEKLPQFK